MANDSPFELRLSSAASWVRCAAYPMMNRTPQAIALEETGDVTVREEGTAMHEAAECMMRGEPIEASNGMALTDEMLDAVMVYVDLLNSFGGGWHIEETMGAPSIHPKCGGTCDAFQLHERPADGVHIRVIDFKGGYRFVKVFPNWQLFGYLAAILDTYPFLNLFPDTVVEFMIVQPRAYGKKQEPHRMTLRDTQPYIDSLRMAAHIAMGDRARAIAGPQCDDCNARAACSVCHDAGMRAIEVAGEPDIYDLQDAALDYEMMRLEEAKQVLEARLTGLQAQAMQSIRRGARLPHYALESGAGRLNWIDETKALALGDLMGVDLRKPTQAITPTQAMQRLPKELFDGFAERKRGELKLVRFDGGVAVKAFSHLKGK